MDLRKLPPELQEKAEREINEDPKRVPEDLQYIKDWLKKQSHLKARLDDQFLLTFLRGCKFSLERTKEKIDMYYTVRTLIPEFFKDRDPMAPEIQKVLNAGVCLPLITKDILSPNIVLIRGGYDPSDISHIDVLKTNMMIMDVMLIEDDAMLINGTHIVQDMKGVMLAHLLAPAIAKKAMTCFQEANPTRPKGLHFFNLPSFFDTMFSIFRPFFTEKMKNRMNIHTNNFETLFEQVPKKSFPVEYGGETEAIPFLIEYWKNKVESYRDWFLEDSKYGTVESLRPGKPKTSDELFGVEGSFRKLTVD